jgi:hypothetical protein
VKVIVSFRVLFVLVVVESLALLVEVALLPSQGHNIHDGSKLPSSLLRLRFLITPSGDDGMSCCKELSLPVSISRPAWLVGNAETPL